MSPRENRPTVTAERRQEWLQRHEDGQSPPKIAKADNVDARTVRKHIAIAMQEKENKDARASVLRNSLERHYADLCRCAERLAGTASSINISLDHMASSAEDIAPFEPHLRAALRQHIPRSPIWRLLAEQTKLYTSKAGLTRKLNSRIEASVSADTDLVSHLNPEEDGVIPGIVTALVGQAPHWLRGPGTLNAKGDLKFESTGDSLGKLAYGAFNMGTVRAESVELVREAIVDWTARVKECEEFAALKKASDELQRVQDDLKDEIAVIALRRVVPGRCRYCPV